MNKEIGLKRQLKGSQVGLNHGRDKICETEEAKRAGSWIKVDNDVS